MSTKDYTAIGREILYAVRNQLYLSFPYLDNALSALNFISAEEAASLAGPQIDTSSEPETSSAAQQDTSSVHAAALSEVMDLLEAASPNSTGTPASKPAEPADQPTATDLIATDGFNLIYNGAFLARLFQRSDILTNRLYLHTILHCMLRHLYKKQGKISSLWDLACDAAVESLLDELPHRVIQNTVSPARRKFYGECRAEMKVLTAEAIYRKLLRDELSEPQINQLSRLFLQDDHGYWDPKNNDPESQENQDKKWQDISEKTQTSAGTVLADQATGGENIIEQLRVESRDSTDYRAFLKRFAAPREIMEVDGDSFDYIYYTYGLSIYGNMPLVEPPETREEKRIEDLIIAIDTSMSTSGELVKEFLRCTYGILRSTETFTRRLNIHIMQCDDQLRSDTKVSSMRELEEYMENVQLSGGSATDFRPVFERANELVMKGEFTSLRGLIYFTDGMGKYPVKRPPFDAAFVMLEEPPLSMKIPPWCIRLILNVDDLEKPIEQEGWYDNREDLPEL